MGVAIPCTTSANRRIKPAASSLAGLLIAIPVCGLAQDVPAPTNAAQDLEEVVVTGTNIRSAGFSALVPLQVVGAAQLENIGTAQFNDVLKTIPGNAGSEMFTEASPRAGNSQFNLRGLGYTSTLTLLNGRRAGISPLSDETGAEFVDINQFPLAMVERIEVLKDGASAIYGSDAVAGVVNIITRRGFDGAEVSAGYQDATNEAANVNFALGQRFDRGFVSVYGTYYYQTGNDRTDFDWLVKRIHGNGVLGRSQLLNANAAPSNYRPAGRNAAGQPIGLAGGVAFADPDCQAAGGVFRVRDNGTVDGSQCLHDFADQVAIIPEASRAQVFTEFEYELTDSVGLFGEASYSRNVLRSTKGPGSYSNGAAVSNSSGNIFIPASHPFNFFVRDPANANRLAYIGPDSWNPAIHTAVDLVAASRVFGVQYADGAAERRSTTDYVRTVMGLDAQFGSRLSGRVSYQFAAADFEDLQPFRYDAAALNAALLDGTLNPFGTSVARPDLISPKDSTSTARNEHAVIDRVLVTSRDTARSQQHVVDAVLSGNLFDLSAGSVGFAVGGQYRTVSLKETPDALQASGLGDAPTAAITIDREQDVFAVYSELSAPLGSRADAQLALRYEDYGGNVGSSVDPKFAMRVTPMEWLTLRGSIGTSFQAPTIRQTSESVTRIFINDPTTLDNGVLTCRDTGRTSNPLVRTSGDESLKPQTATNYNFGIILSPLRALDFGVDYWHYKYEDLIAASANAQAIVTRDCADGIPNDPRITREGAGLLNEIATKFINVGQIETDGVDLSAAYQFDTGIVGSFQLTADATYMRKFDVLGGEGGVFDGAGSRNFANNFRSMPKWRTTTGLLWDCGTISSNLAVRYIDGYTNDQSNNAPISSFTAVDLSVAYRLAWGGRGDKPMMLSVGADNLFDRDPPSLVRYNAAGQLIRGTVNDVDRPSYDAYSGVDIRGRILWARAKYEF
jgi:iron complex outermembrane recepter protein